MIYDKWVAITIKELNIIIRRKLITSDEEEVLF